MWLLNVHTLKLEEFYGEETPDYAILSHTWGKEEVTFQELNAGTGTNKAGYRKIVGTCGQATKDGFEYCWVDTCCIDKSSSAELSEAINSMFEWYKQSSVCYAYLSDVELEQMLQYEPDSQDVEEYVATLRQFEASRWFQRGWTLQELIAPRHVIFYQKDWQCIGTKSALALHVKGITRIPERLLKLEVEIASFDVGTRMSWAAGRQTKRVEDIAYCLFGIFGVNLALFYGEGSKTFYRLQEEIIRTKNDATIFAWTAFMGFRTSWEFIPVGFLAPDPSAFRPAPLKRLGSEETILSQRDGFRFEVNPAAEPATITSKGIKVNWPILNIQLPDPGDPYAPPFLVLPIRYRDALTRRMSYVSLPLFSSSASPLLRVPGSHLTLITDAWHGRDRRSVYLGNTRMPQKSRSKYFSVSMFCAADKHQFVNQWACERALSASQIRWRPRLQHVYCSLKTTPPAIVLFLRHVDTGLRFRLNVSLASGSGPTCRVDLTEEDELVAIKELEKHWGPHLRWITKYRSDMLDREGHSICLGSQDMYGDHLRDDLRRVWERCASKLEGGSIGSGELYTAFESGGAQYKITISISACPRPKTILRDAIERGLSFRLELGLQRVTGETSSNR